MGLESTIICVDNSEYMRNGDYVPTRLQAQQDAVNTICRFKLRANPENNVGLITLAHNAEIVTTLTSDVGKILTCLHHVQPGGVMNLLVGLRIAHLALKHRGSRAHRMRVVAFVGSPLTSDEREVIRVAKKLKKESVILDIINFGETENNTRLLEILVNTVNGKDSTTSHLVTVPAPCAHLADALLTSPVMQNEEGGASAAQFASGSAFEFGVDPNEDPELALALRVSMEEQRQRQQEEERRTNADGQAATGDASDATASASATPASSAAAPTAMDTSEPASDATPATAGSATAVAVSAASTVVAGTEAPTSAVAGGVTSEEAMLQQALAMSLEGGAPAAGAAAPAPAPAAAAASAPAAAAAAAVVVPDFATMTEEEQIAYAMQISMQDCEAMEVETKTTAESSATTTAPTATATATAAIAATTGTAATTTTTATTVPAAPATAPVYADEEEDLTAVMADAAFLEGVLNKLPGVNPNSDVVKQAIDSYTTAAAAGSKKEKTKAEEDKKKKKEEEKESESKE